ncbi:hypothetical protein SNE40_014748 [Patella caerulea]|uniref:Cysteine and tyrosine-rich protein 1 n=1 Tax=Patella caerulea TaxID=87958 RepID=A0AAN8JIM0_PATCE
MTHLISLSILLSVFSGCYAGSYCYTSSGLLYYYTYCSYGCCFDGCCAFSIGTIVGIVIACIVGFVILVVVCIALNKKNTRGRVVVAPTTTNVHHVSPGYGQQPMMVYNTMPGQYPPQAPPPYTYTNPAYPPPPQKDGQQQHPPPPPQDFTAPPGTVPQPQMAPVGFEGQAGPTAPAQQQPQQPPNPFSAYANNKS